MKSIQTKYLTLILCCILVATVTAVTLGVGKANTILQEDSAEILELKCTGAASAIDDVLEDISQSVTQLGNFAVERLGDPEEVFNDPDKLDEYVDKVRAVSVNAAEMTDGSVAVYLRFNKDLTTSKTGFFITKDKMTGTYIDHELTDLSLYEEDDVEHVGWYYLPFQAGKGSWMDPYQNKNIGIYMISYVMPIYKDGVPIAIVGMDINMNLLYEKVNSLKVYDSGYAFLWGKNGDLLCHPDHKKGLQKQDFKDYDRMMWELSNKAKSAETPIAYKIDGTKKYLRSKELVNGMTLSVCVPKSEIEQPVRTLIAASVFILLLLLLIAIPVTVQLTAMMASPIQQLTESARKIVEGDLDVSIQCKSHDEIGLLAQSFGQMAEKLKEQMTYIRNLAYMDVMTQTRNKTAYEECLTELEKKIEEKTASFSVVVMDINNLKHMNDMHGHEMGDALISDSASLMKKVFDAGSLYRIGGDEFTAILMDMTLSDTTVLLQKFQEEIEKFNRGERRYGEELHVAAGASEFHAETDRDYAEVFRRADSLMYQDKQRQKQSQEKTEETSHADHKDHRQS